MSLPGQVFSRRFFFDRLLARVLVPVFLGVLLTTLLAYFYTRRTMESLAKDQISQSLGYLDREVTLRAREMSMQIHLMAQEEVLRLALEDSYLGRSARASAQRKIESYVRTGAFERIYLMNTEGRLVLASDPALVKTLNVADRDYFRKALAGQLVLDTVPVSRVTGRPFLAVATPLRTPNGAVAGVVVGITHTELFARQMLNETRIGSSGGAYFLSAQGVMLASPTWASSDHFAPKSRVSDILANAGDQHFHLDTQNGQHRVWLPRKNESTGWILVMETDEDEMLAPATKLAAVSGTVSVLTLALVAVALGMLRRVMASLRNSEANSRTVTELSPVGIITFGPSGSPEYLNKQARSILNLGPDEPPPPALLLEDDQGRHLTGERSPVAQVLAQKQPVTGLLAWYTPPGGWRKALYFNATPLSALGSETPGVVATLEDITERMQALELLHQSEKRFSSLFRLSPDSILLTDVDSGVIVDVNEAFTTTSGYSRDEAIGQTVRELGLYTDDEQRQQINSQIRRDGFVLNAEIRGKSRDGKVAIYSLSSQIIEIGDAKYSMTVVRDITERTQAVEKLRMSEERFSKLFRLSPEAIILIDFETTKITDANEAFLQITGHRLEEVVGHDTLELGFYADPEVRARLYELHTTEGFVDSYEFEGRRKDGSSFICSTSGQIVELGEKRFILVLMRDITEQKLAEQALRQSEERFSALFRLSPDSILLTELESGSIVDLNETFTRTFGYAREEAIGRSARDLNLYADDLQRQEINEQVKREGQVTNAEVQGRVAGGGEAVFSLSSQVITISGERYRMTVVRDITESKRAAEALADSERRFRTIFENAPYAIAINRISDGRYVDVNRAFLAGVDLDREQALQLSTRDMVPMSEEEERARAQNIVDSGGIHNAEIVFTRKDGRASSLIYSTVPLVVGGEPCLLSMTVDITDRKQAEEALRQSNRALTAFKEFSESMLQARSEAAFIADICRILVEVCGYRMAWVGMADEGPGKRVWPVGQWGDGGQALLDLVITWDDAETGRGAVGTAIKTRRSVVARSAKEDTRFAPWRSFFDTYGYKSMIALPLRHGEVCLGALSIYAHETEAFDADEKALLTQLAGDLTFGILSLRQREAHRQAEEQIRQSEEKFSRLFLLSPDAIVLLHMGTQRLAEVNDAYVELFGYTREELVGRTTLELNLYADPARRSELFEKITREGHVENFEVDCRRRDGSIAVCSLSCHILAIDGEPYMMSVLRDITEIKRMQEMMVQTEKMISVGGIAAGIAHEINNPLGIVLQAAQNLVQRTRPDFQKNIDVANTLGFNMELMQRYMQARKLDIFLQDIQSAAVRASAIIRHMLDFSRRSESRRKVCDLASIIDKAVSLASSDYDLKKSYDFKRIKITRDYDDELPVLNCTETEIEQVLLNLLRNAAQALAASDPPVQEPRIDIRLTALAGGVRIEIADNGPGMPPEVQRRVFEPFFTTKPPGIGTGLGLSVSYFIVTKGHGGAMSVFSQPGAGTRFTIELPAEEQGGAQ